MEQYGTGDAYSEMCLVCHDMTVIEGCPKLGLFHSFIELHRQRLLWKHVDRANATGARHGKTLLGT